MIISFDLDSTLANTRPRQHLINQVDRSKTDWDAYSMACAGDLPGPAYALARSFQDAGATLVVCSWRSECAREQTEDWLFRMELKVVKTVLYDVSTHGDGYKTDVVTHDEWKAAALCELSDYCKEHFGEPITLHVDDWLSVKETVEARTSIPVVIVDAGYGTELG